MIGSPQHRLAKWLISILEPIRLKFSKFTVNDSFSYVEFIREYKEIETECYMCSYDIKSLFTNVPLDEVLTICMEQLYKPDLTPPTIPPDVLKELLDMATHGVQFSFNEVMFQQDDGVAMGSPLGPILANIFVGYHEQRLLEKCKLPMTYRRYVDDTFAIFSNKQQSVEFLHHLSQMHPSLQFTIEGERDNQLPFLDVLVEKNGTALCTSVYRKQTFNGDYLHWTSFSPIKRKMNIVSCLVNRAVKICSPSKLQDELRKITTIFSKLGYPDDLVKRTIRNGTHPRKPSEGQKDTNTVYLRLPYIGPVAERFRNQIESAIKTGYDNLRLRTIFTTRTLFNGRAKDRTPTLDQTNVIYKFTCSCESVYVGRTGRRLRKRISEHVKPGLLKYLNAVNNNNVGVQEKSEGQRRSARLAAKSKSMPIEIPSCPKSLTSIGKHLKAHPDCGRKYEDSQFSVLAKGRSKFHLQVLEAVYIQTIRPVLCAQKESIYNTKLFKSHFSLGRHIA